MNLIEWRKNGERRSMALDMLNQPTMKEMLSVMEAEHPGKHRRAVSDGFGATRVLGQIEGFQEALDMLKAFAEPLPTPPEKLEATFGTPEIQDLD